MINASTTEKEGGLRIPLRKKRPELQDTLAYFFKKNLSHFLQPVKKTSKSDVTFHGLICIVSNYQNLT
ncbi:hypothetical protein DCM91_16375 [Chitinophaga costaii]|nr:hypothetical protein DCM91_16375 [Chitinophaga costaii]